MDAEKLKTQIEVYSPKADRLEKDRKEIVIGINAAANEDIIPSLESQLPEGYTFNSGRTEVVLEANGEGQIPTGFSLELRIDYEGNPLTGHHIEEARKISNVNDSLRSELDEYAALYSLESVNVTSEPIQIG